MDNNTQYSVKIHTVTKETAEASSISFDLNGNEFSYLPGQYITLIVNINGTEHRRAYSLSSAPNHDKLLTVTIKRVKGGLVSNHLLDHAKAGDELKILAPQGQFFYDKNQNPSEELVLFAGGSGITPMFSILKTALRSKPELKLKLLYANKTLDSIIFREELEVLEKEHQNRLEISHFLSQEQSKNTIGIASRMEKAHLKPLLNESNLGNTSFYMCGPDGMMQTIEAFLNEIGAKKERINKEKFQATNIEDSGLLEDVNFDEAEICLVYEDEEHKFKLKPDDNILETALDKGIDLPYSCQSGLCTACMAQCVEGEINMTEEDGVSEDEREDGYFLPCVSYPKSKNIKIVFD